MNRRTKKEGNKILRWELEINTNTNIFEKNPKRGGTPASESIAKEITLVRTWFEPKFEKEKSVFMFVPTTCKTVVKSMNDVKL